MEYYLKCGGFFFLLCFLLSICDNTTGHPQCLDSRPPFQAVTNLTFCPQYSDFGCCTVENDNILEMRYTNIRNRVPPSKSSLWASCSDKIKTFLCQRCSPYAAHIFDSEVSQNENPTQPRAFPGLCGGYCTDFFNSCQDMIQYYMAEFESTHIDEKNTLLSYASQGSPVFCSKVGLTDVDYCYPELLSNPILNGNISLETVTKPGCLCMEQLPGVSLRNPIFLKHANDSSNRLFVGEQIGLIHIMYPDGTILPEPFLDISYEIQTTSYKGDERGMLGMAFHPKFILNGKFYVYYSTPLSYDERLTVAADHKIRIKEFRVDPNNPNQADYRFGSSRVIMEVYEPFWNHNGGEILFGDDGYMYIFIGDGGKAGDPLEAGQNLTMVLAKVLRIDVDKVDHVNQRQYSIPPDNPFVDVVGALPEIYAYGIRNIWRCGKDRGNPNTGYGKGRIVCGDVGQSNREELILLQKGANYGWNLMEGTAIYCLKPECEMARQTLNLVPPIHDYPHSVGKSVTGGHFYRGCHSPNLNGAYIYGDFMSGRLFKLLEDPVTKKWENEELNMCGPEMCTPPLQNSYVTSIISFGEDEDGEVYMLSTAFASTTRTEGTIYRIVDPSRRGNPATCRSAQVNTPTTPVPVTTVTVTPEPTTTVRTSTVKDTSRANIPVISGMLYGLTVTVMALGCMVL